MTTDTAALVKAWVVALSVAGFVLIWSTLARAPFPTPTRESTNAVVATTPVATTADAQADPQLVALVRRERALRARAAAVQRRHDERWATYRRQLSERQSLIRAIQSAPVPAFSAPVFTTSSAASAPAPAAATTRSS